MADLIDGGWQEFTTVGTSSVTPPSGATTADMVAIGGGAGGGTGIFGNPGAWGAWTMAVTGPISVTVGAGGAVGQAGSASTAGPLTAKGGQGTTRNPNSSAARTYTVFDRSFVGGAKTQYSKAGNAPGGGGGSTGARGQVWVRFWINPKLENLYVGGKEVQAVYVGSKEVTAVYSGNKIVYGAA